jgi:hypothetical protein
LVDGMVSIVRLRLLHHHHATGLGNYNGQQPPTILF